jgi:hypothetical protein
VSGSLPWQFPQSKLPFRLICNFFREVDLLKPYLLPLISFVATVIIVGLFVYMGAWPGLNLAVAPGNILSIMSPLLLAAGFIERATEVVIAPWRDAGATIRYNALAALKADPAATPAQIAEANSTISAFQDQTKQYAFAAAFAFGLASSIAGVRALWPFIDTEARKVFDGASKGQKTTFIFVDVILSAALLAGGANGIHSVINAFTTYFDTTAKKAQQSADSQ